MRLIEPGYEIVQQQPGLEGMYKQIELCGRISHKSEDQITETSYKKFIETMRKLQHFATFEHGAVYLKFEEPSNPNMREVYDTITFYERNPYSKVVHYDWAYYVTTNYRVICENNREEDLKFWCEPTEHHERRHTVIFTCDIGVSREYNRHRVNSILEESTRYCNYTKDKFGAELNIIIPIWLRERTSQITQFLNTNFKGYVDDFAHGGEIDWKDIDYWLFANLCSEYCYNKLIKDFGWVPQQARTILPLDTKTTLAHTAFDSDWEHFFDLRALGTTGAPHPSAKELVEPLMNQMNFAK